MKIKSLSLLLVLSVVLLSCEPDDPPSTTNRKYQPQANYGRNNAIGVHCPTSGTNCFLYLAEGDYPIYARQVLNNFYADYATDSLGRFFQNNDWRQVFPSWTEIDEVAVEKIISKQYGTVILSDSSIVILKNPQGDFSEANVIYAFGKQ